MSMVSSSLNGRVVKWKNNEKEDSRGVVRDAFVAIQQVQSPLSKIIQASPVWLFLVEVLDPEKYSGSLVVVAAHDDTVSIEPVT